MVFSQPFQKADKPGINLQNVLADSSFLSFKLKSCPPDGVGKDPVGMVDKLPALLSRIRMGCSGELSGQLV